MIRLYLPDQPNQCFEALYNRYVDKVYRRCLSMTQDSVEAEDFTHDIFLKVFNKLDDFQERSKFSTWLYSISHNYCIDQIRVGKRLTTTPLEDKPEHEATDSDETVLQEETLLLVKQAMDALSSEETTLLRLKYEDGLSVEAIAQKYNIKVSAVKMRLKRSRDKIHQLYQQQYNS